jgi:hypothetical protein
MYAAIICPVSTKGSAHFMSLNLILLDEVILPNKYKFFVCLL